MERRKMEYCCEQKGAETENKSRQQDVCELLIVCISYLRKVH